MATAQLSLDFTAIAPEQEQTHSMEYLIKAAKTYSADKIANSNKIRGIFYHLGAPYVCTGECYQWGLRSVYLTRLYSTSEWDTLVAIEEPPYRWGHRIKHRGKSWVMGDRITLKPHPHEREISIAQYKINWSIAKLERTLPYADGERKDPNWGIEYYRQQVDETRSILLEGIEEAESLGIPIDQVRIFQIKQKLDKIREEFNA